MGVIYRRKCDYCGKQYAGRGIKYCSPLCASQAAKMSDNIIASSIVPELDPTNLVRLDEEYLYEETAARRAREYLFEATFPDGVLRLNVCSDFEFPYHDPIAIHRALRRGIEEGCDILVIAGDLNHHTAVNPFGVDKSIPLKVEKQLSENLITLAIGMGYKKIVMVSGNHDRRLTKAIMRMPNAAEIKEVIKGMDIMQSLAEQFPDHVIYANGWWGQIGGLIISHPGRYSSVANNILVNTKNTVDYFLKRGHQFAGVAQGHSHILGSGIHCRKYVFETGCLCKQIDYNVCDRQTNPIWEQGHAIIELQGNNINWNDSRVYHISTVGLNNNLIREDES